MLSYDTERSLLRALSAVDAPRIAALIGNWNVARMLSRVPYPYTVQDAADFLGTLGLRTFESGQGVFAIVHKGELAGVVGIEPITGAPSLGYWLGEPYWGLGLATKAVGDIVRRFFSESDRDGLSSGVFADNLASLRVQKKLGFVETGESEKLSVARGHKVPHIDTILTRERHLAMHR